MHADSQNLQNMWEGNYKIRKQSKTERGKAPLSFYLTLLRTFISGIIGYNIDLIIRI